MKTSLLSWRPVLCFHSSRRKSQATEEPLTSTAFRKGGNRYHFFHFSEARARKCLPGGHSSSSLTMGFPEIKMKVLFHSTERTQENQTQGAGRKIQSVQQSDVAFTQMPAGKQRRKKAGVSVAPTAMGLGGSEPRETGSMWAIRASPWDSQQALSVGCCDS